MRSHWVEECEANDDDDVNNSDCNINFFNNDFKFLISILNLIINVNNLTFKSVIICSENKQINDYIFDLFFQIIIEDFVLNYFELLNLIDQIFEIINENKNRNNLLKML